MKLMQTTDTQNPNRILTDVVDALTRVEAPRRCGLRAID
jgi:hypothetical protein